ncbi:nucleoside monophosphate kinase [Candidatus Woesearchaeota archaeon]|nr:nucleoside monophosphate kinase [Candidatus Woesearchaeota archaeon]
MKIMLFGPQGAGKGTIGAMLSKKYEIPLLSAGQMLRDAMKEGTEVGKIAEKYINEGNLVPPEVITNVIKERIVKDDCENGFILDGFPRNLEQAELFGEKMDEIDYMIEFEAPRELLIHRLTGRRTCKNCGEVYNIHPDCDPNPKVSGKCDKCNGELYQREDDTEEAIKKRLAIYDEETVPVLEKYKDRVVKIDAGDNPQAIFERVVKVLEKGSQ